MATRHTILITGAGSGIGRGLCLEFGKAGHTVVASDISLDSAEQTVSMMSNPSAGYAHRVDVTSDSQVQELTSSLAGLSVDVLINNAGLQHVASLESFAQEKWDHLLNVMLHGTCRMTRALLPKMREGNYGRIINIGSIHSLVGSPFKSAYVAAKHGLLGFSKVIALETAEVDITMNTICPSYVRTPLVDAQITNQAAAHGISEAEVIEKIMLAPMPKKAFITIEEIAATALFLMSSSARNISGQSIVVDGGWTCC